MWQSHRTVQNIKLMSLCVNVEGGGETEAAEEAAGAPEAGSSTLPHELAATARPGAMETPHSAQRSQQAGKSPVSLRWKRSVTR